MRTYQSDYSFEGFNYRNCGLGYGDRSFTNASATGSCRPTRNNQLSSASTPKVPAIITRPASTSRALSGSHVYESPISSVLFEDDQDVVRLAPTHYAISSYAQINRLYKSCRKQSNAMYSRIPRAELAAMPENVSGHGLWQSTTSTSTQHAIHDKASWSCKKKGKLVWVEHDYRQGLPRLPSGDLWHILSTHGLFPRC
jgi:hypothetical protein